MTPGKILAPAYTTAISETLSQMPLNLMLLGADTCDNVSDILGLIQGRGADCLHAVNEDANFEPSVVLSRRNYLFKGTSRGTSRKVAEVTCATPLNFNR